MKEICADLESEQGVLDAMVSGIPYDLWTMQTPAEGWTVADQIGHLAFFDQRTTIAIDDSGAFADELAVAASDIDAYMEDHLSMARHSSQKDLMASWRTARVALLSALSRLDPSDRIPWYGPDMSARTFATARLMEVWAHGQDVADALGVHREPTRRLRNIALLGVKTMGWSFLVNGEEQPKDPVRVALTGPGGDEWVWNEQPSENEVSGDAEEFCLVVTQRRNITSTSLEVHGPVAQRWMHIAQAFAGPPGKGRPPTP